MGKLDTACSIDGCNRKHLAKGMCKLHYYRNYRRGCPENLLEKLQKEFEEIEKTKLAYAAGYLDADGSFMLEGNKVSISSPRISAVSIDLPVLQFMASLFGGAPRLVKRSTVNPRHRPVYVWNISGVRAIAIARAVMPFLVIKGVQAYLLSCFDYEAKWSNGGLEVAMPEYEAKRRVELMQEIRSWNARDYFATAQ